jgi:hypothetical protein
MFAIVRQLFATYLTRLVMAETELVTARYLRQAEEERQARLEAEAAAQAAAEAEEQTTQPPARQSWSSEVLMRRVSYVLGGGAMLCLVMLAVPYAASMGSKKRMSPLDWWLRLGGASSDQTFDKFLRDSLATTQKQLQSQLQDSPFTQIDTSNFNWANQCNQYQPSTPAPRRR